MATLRGSQWRPANRASSACGLCMKLTLDRGATPNRALPIRGTNSFITDSTTRAMLVVRRRRVRIQHVFPPGVSTAPNKS